MLRACTSKGESEGRMICLLHSSTSSVKLVHASDLFLSAAMPGPIAQKMPQQAPN